MTAESIFREANRRGLTLSRRRQFLRVAPKERLTPDFAAALRTHRVALLAYLCARGRKTLRVLPRVPSRRNERPLYREFFFRGRSTQPPRLGHKQRRTTHEH